MADPAGHHSTLRNALFGPGGLTRDILLVLAGTALIAAAARISVPMWPVPMTLQTLAILFIGFSYGARLGAVTVFAYLVEGALGLPVFASGNGGLAYMVGPTFGFLLGYLMMAWLAGWAADRGVTRSAPATIAAALAISLLLYVPGLAWPALVLGVEGAALWTGWMAPFLVGDAVKAVIAALLVTGGLAIAKRRG